METSSKYIQQYIKLSNSLAQKNFKIAGELLMFWAKEFKKLLNADGVLIRFFDTQSEKWDIYQFGEFPINRSDQEEIYNLISKGKEFFVYDIDNKSSANLKSEYKKNFSSFKKLKFVSRRKIKTFLAFDLNNNEINDEKVQYGQFIIYSTQPPTYPYDFLPFVSSLVTQLIKNIQLITLSNSVHQQGGQLDSHISKSIKSIIFNENIEIEELLNNILDEAIQALSGKGGKLYLVMPGRAKLKLMAIKGVGNELKIGTEYPLSAGMVGKVFQTKKYLIVDDYRKWPHRIKEIEHLFTSVIEVPLFIKDVVVGVVAVFDDTQKKKFTKKDVPILERLVQRAALSIYNVQLFNDLKVKNQELEILNKIGYEISQSATTNNVASIAHVVYKQTSLLIDTTNFFLCLVQENKRDLFHLFWVFNGQRLTPFKKEISGFTGWVIKNKTPLLITNWSKEEASFPVKPNIVTAKQESWLGVPMKLGNQVIGVIAVQSPKTNAFNESTQNLFETIASQAAIAIENARRYSSVKMRKEALVEIGQKLTADIRLKEQEVLELIYQQAKSRLGLKNISISLYDEKKDTVHFALVVVSGRRIDILNEPGWEPRYAGKGKTEQIIRTGKPILLSTFAEVKKAKFSLVPGRDADEREKLPNCWLGVPMKVGNKVLGVISNFSFPEDSLFNEDDIAILQALADHAAIAIDNSRLFYDINERLGRSLKLQKALLEASKKLNAGIRFTETQVIELIYKQASQLLGMENLSIALYDESTDTVRFVLVAIKGSRINVENEPGWEARPPGNGKTKRVIKTKQHLLVLAPNKDSEAAEFTSIPDHKYDGDIQPNAWLGVPMIVGKKVRGVVATYSYSKSKFYGSDEIDVLQALADQAAIAIDNIGLYQRVREQALTLTRLNKLTQDLVAIEGLPDHRKLLKNIAESARKVLKADLIELYEYRLGSQLEILPPISAGQLLNPRIPGQIDEKDAVWKLIDRIDPLFEENAQAKESVFIVPYTTRKRKGLPNKRFVFREKILSCAAIPLRAGKENIGLMFANYRSVHSFSPEQKELIELFAGEAAIAIKNAELLEKYIETQRYLENIIEHSPDAIIVLDEKGCIKIFNKACEQIWGYKAAEVVGKDVANYYESPTEARAIGEKIWKSKGFQVENIETKVKVKSGELIPIQLSAAYLFNERDDRIGSVGIFTDMRPIKKLEAEKIQAEQLAALGKLAHTVGHDIKHDIGTVLFYIEPLMYQSQENNDQDSIDIYKNMKDALWDATDKLQNMLSAGKPRIPQRQKTLVNQIFENLYEPMHRQASSRSINFSLDLPSTHDLVLIDPELFRQVFFNLFNNSIYAIEYKKNSNGHFETGSIKVTVGVKDSNISINWRDNGIGISPESQSKIFNAFYTQKDSTTGTGLGLFIVKSIIEKHEGLISVKSLEGKYTCFNIVLPKTS